MAKQTNEQKYKTAEERKIAHTAYCNRMSDECPLLDDRGTDTRCTDCAFNWLSLEAEEEKPEPCFYCGHAMHYRVEHRNFTDKHWLECTNSKCNFESPKYESKEETIAEHNRVARAVRAAEKGEVK